MRLSGQSGRSFVSVTSQVIIELRAKKIQRFDNRQSLPIGPSNSPPSSMFKTFCATLRQNSTSQKSWADISMRRRRWSSCLTLMVRNGHGYLMPRKEGSSVCSYFIYRPFGPYLHDLIYRITSALVYGFPAPIGNCKNWWIILGMEKNKWFKFTFLFLISRWNLEGALTRCPSLCCAWYG